ncbi:MAG: TraB/GumN family protein [Phenylobacterium sp.]|uniref:TraB/GumN family protein n=1 Tax=Phenylobacterium sp. TaxID=1871053 RepID=UPI001A4A833B|nr:TraB/GumN family protein [Phenylobacterium sp.]MBL8771072.1 TraB/GumN family protein [Phenylobacterium sp.]
MTIARALVGALALGLALAGPAAAQGRLEDPEAVIVAELVVQAKEPGPAWWRVEDDDTTVWILGMPDSDLPAGTAWDRRFVDRRLKGANSLIVGTRIGLSGRLRDVPLILRTVNQMKSKTPLEETLPEPLRSRFVAARERVGQPAGRYSGWKGLVAGMRLAEDARGKGAVAVTSSILRQAKREKVKAVDPARYQIAPFLKQATGSLTPALHQQCLEEAVRDVEAGRRGRDAAAARAWTRGDVAGALTAPRNFQKCVLLIGGGGELWRRAIQDQADAIAAALQRPGHSVALVSLRPLLAQGGVAERLEARGLEVIGPGGEAESDS